MEYLNLIVETSCTGCSSCANGCPVQCIKMEPDKKGFLFPMVDRNVCIQCGICETSCPVLNKESFHTPADSVFYGCKNSDDTIRLASSSGGFFYELAKSVIDKGGVVFGARFSEDYKRVYHSSAMTMEDVRPMMVSKYVQSEIGGSYITVRNCLKEGRTVLFTGTPCQIAGLRSFLGEIYDNLILAEIVCHGVPSPKVWDLYLSSLEKEYGGKVTYVTFRDKSKSWRQSDFRAEFGNGHTFVQPNKDNSYMKSFLRNLNLRDSCTDCKFKRFASGADITMGDFWGSTEIDRTYNDDLGISVIALNTEKGSCYFNRVLPLLKGVIPLSEKTAFVFNSSYAESAKLADAAELFYDDFTSDSFSALVDNLITCEKQNLQKPVNPIGRMIRKVQRYLNYKNE